MRKSQSHCLFFFILVLLWSCTDPQTRIQEIIAEESAWIEEQLAHIKNIGLLDAQLNLNDSIQPLAIKDLKVIQHAKAQGNAAVIYPEQFSNLSKAIYFEYEGDGKAIEVLEETTDAYRLSKKRNMVTLATSLYKKQQFPDDSTEVAKLQDYKYAFAAFGRIKYLVVPHQVMRIEPKMKDNLSFEQGKYVARVAVYQVQEEKLLGTFEVKAENNTQISSYSVNNQSLFFYHLVKDFSKNIRQEFRKALKANTQK